MYGWRLRIGLIVPSSNTTMEPEFYRVCPEGVSIHTARVLLEEVTPDALIRMADRVLDAAEMLKSADVNVIVYGCTSGALIGGVEWEKELTSKIESEIGVETITTASAVVQALKVLDIRRVVVATPYIDKINELEKSFLEVHGIKVLSIRGLGITKNIEIGKLAPWVPYRLAKEIFKPEADGIFISCTNFRTLEVIEKLEREFGKPVVTSNQASIWAALKKIREPIEGCGKLLREEYK